VGYQATEEHILPLLDEVKNDPEPAVRQALAEQIPELFRFFKEVTLTHSLTHSPTLTHSLTSFVTSLLLSFPSTLSLFFSLFVAFQAK
jgi:hypothetical protein